MLLVADDCVTEDYVVAGLSLVWGGSAVDLKPLPRAAAPSFHKIVVGLSTAVESWFGAVSRQLGPVVCYND